jgi:homoserine kinase
VKRAALDARALGCSISGGGPSVFALADSDDVAHAALAAMLGAFEAKGVRADGRVASVDERGARLVEVS